jgi:hypothetical protein
VRKLNGEGINPKIEIPSHLVAKLDIEEVFKLGCTDLKSTSPHLHLDTKQELLKLYW